MPGQLRYERGQLLSGTSRSTSCYNRLVDFCVRASRTRSLRAAYHDDAVVVTPNPRVHALYADKRNLALLSDQAALRAWGLPAEMLVDLAGVPRTRARHIRQCAAVCGRPGSGCSSSRQVGHGSKAVYRGDKVTRGVWAEIIRGGYVAQEFAAPSERMIKLDGSPQARKDRRPALCL